MALDFHIANSADEASTTEPVVSVELDSHAALFRVLLPVSEFPLLQRLADYYADCRFDRPELAMLVAEIQTALDRMPNLNRSWLRELQVACEQAIDLDQSLLAICD